MASEAMTGFDRQRLVSALVLASTALFLVAVAPRFPYRRAAQRVAVAGYILAAGVVIAWVAAWLLGLAG
jgi:hypothetical protein